MNLPERVQYLEAANHEKLIQAIIHQIEKDFNVFAISIEYTASNESPYQNLIAGIQPHIESLLVNDFSRLLSVLYRIDVSEKKLVQVEQMEPTKSMALLITELIIEREYQKVFFRMRYSSEGFKE